MYNYQRVQDISFKLIEAVKARDALQMQLLVDELERAYKEEYSDRIDGYDSWYAFVLMNLASIRYFAHNNMYGLVHARYDDVASRIEGFHYSSDYTLEQKDEIDKLFAEIESINKATPEAHQNLVIGRNDTRCTLCRQLPANKTGSHMVPNFLAHPSFSWDGKGKRFHEALNHDYLNAPDLNCQFYGREVPEWRFAQGEGKDEVTDEDLAKNINQLEYDNEFCSRCEDRFGVLESAYSQYYNGQQKKIDPRIAYLFWLSVLWRMSMGSMSIFMDMDDELSLRRLLDENMLNTADEIANSDTDLGDWKYAIFRAEGLKEGDKGIFGYRKEKSPYVVMYNDLVMVFYHETPTDRDLVIGPITVNRSDLNDWNAPEKSVKVDRRFFMDVRDWITETSYDFYDPVRETAMRIIREDERANDCVIPEYKKQKIVKAARLMEEPKGRMLRLHKFQRITVAWFRLKEAEEKNEEYNPLSDEELFLKEENFHKYYEDLANLAKYQDVPEIEKFPFYKEARAYITDDSRWSREESETLLDTEYAEAFDELMQSMKPKHIRRILGETTEPYVNPYNNIGRNDPCPCGSGKKYKKCCGSK